MAAGQLLVPYSSPALTVIGQIAAGTTMTVFNTGTLTLATLYADFGLTTPIFNPQTANSAGRFTDQTTVIWASDAQAYDVALAFPDGSNLTFDNIFVLEGQSSTSGFAPINSPAFTGVPTAPTPATNDNTNKLATTAFVKNQNYAPVASPSFTGSPTAPTPAPGNNSTNLATTAFVEAAITGGTAFGLTSFEMVLPNGFYLKGGQSLQSITSPTTKSITFVNAFPTGCFYADAIIYNPSTSSSTVTGTSLVTSSTSGATFLFNGFQSGSYNAVPGFYWWAIGY